MPVFRQNYLKFAQNHKKIVKYMKTHVNGIMSGYCGTHFYQNDPVTQLEAPHPFSFKMMIIAFHKT